jgi:hypothetical protein
MYLIDDEIESGVDSLSNNYRQGVDTVATPPAAQMTRFSEDFKRAFFLVANHYQCSNDEMTLMKTAAKANHEAAERCFLAMERQILGPAKGINERIRSTFT